MTRQVRNAYAIEWLRTRWSAPITRTLSGLVGQDLTVEFFAGDGVAYGELALAASLDSAPLQRVVPWGAAHLAPH